MVSLAHKPAQVWSQLEARLSLSHILSINILTFSRSLSVPPNWWMTWSCNLPSWYLGGNIQVKLHWTATPMIRKWCWVWRHPLPPFHGHLWLSQSPTSFSLLNFSSWKGCVSQYCVWQTFNCLLGCVLYIMRPRVILDLQIQSPGHQHTSIHVHTKPQSSLWMVSLGLGLDNFKVS